MVGWGTPYQIRQIWMGSHQEQNVFGAIEMPSDYVTELDVLELGRMTVVRGFDQPYLQVLFYLHLRGKDE